ncbi:hypothetical protein [Pseudooceanicola nanhaiensis]|jgi:hypothetical protein|nr:hypothetical protein [Pseudooceanicola nanhaiensis]
MLNNIPLAELGQEMCKAGGRQKSEKISQSQIDGAGETTPALRSKSNAN